MTFRSLWGWCDRRLLGGNRLQLGHYGDGHLGL